MTFVVTGTGRCGTGWAAEMLGRLGLKVGHEAVFSTTFQGWNDYDGDCSLAAAPHISSGLISRAVHLVRNPLDVLSSFLSNKFFADHCSCHPLQPGAHLAAPYCNYFMRWVPEVFWSPDEVSRVIRYMWYWTRPLVGLPTFQLEKLIEDDEYFCEFLTSVVDQPVDLTVVGDRKVRINPHQTNSRTLSWESLAGHPEQQRFIDISREWGYIGE